MVYVCFRSNCGLQCAHHSPYGSRLRKPPVPGRRTNKRISEVCISCYESYSVSFCSEWSTHTVEDPCVCGAMNGSNMANVHLKKPVFRESFGRFHAWMADRPNALRAPISPEEFLEFL